MDPENERVIVYGRGIVSASACAVDGTTREEIEAAVNARYPTGISSRWTLANESHFATGEPMPCPCNSAPGRQHWLLHC